MQSFGDYEQVLQFGSQALHLGPYSKKPGGQTQLWPVVYLEVSHRVQLRAEGPSHVRQDEWQSLQVPTATYWVGVQLYGLVTAFGRQAPSTRSDVL